jgi:hypothetical protein
VSTGHTEGTTEASGVCTPDKRIFIRLGSFPHVQNFASAPQSISEDVDAVHDTSVSQVRLSSNSNINSVDDNVSGRSVHIISPCSGDLQCNWSLSCHTHG